ncbi:NACHT and WD domain protein [Diplogelasinospora grovesii]|uniref:GPI inositol-deacylase n=1 Tax=Diplogelasinospora grovesii TaxID=303347 RepID=A0AAN6N513_9PEZI|nr:NACHT and WD domain protein [Diplogelasinospora grovesii]
MASTSGTRRSLLSPTRSFLSRRIQSLSVHGANDAAPDSDTWGPYGLTLLHQPSEPLIDFIFVHGLGGGSRKTWSKTPSAAHFWPKEWLPVEPWCKNVRIHTFGYNATWKERAASELNVHDFGQALLTDIRNSPLLSGDDVRTPIVLIGHSMGGQVIKKMLLMAKHDPSCAGVAARIHTIFFLATPHRGSNMAPILKSMLRLVAGNASKAYVDSLVPSSETIQTINDEFRHAYQGIHICSFFETVPTSVGIIVDKGSAILGLPGEQISHLNADHSQMCKFDSPSDSNYCRLRDAFAATISSIEKTTLSSQMHRHRDEMRELLRYLGMKERPGIEFANAIDHRTEGSCSWLTDKESFHQWLDDLDGGPKCLWLQGEPATGKSTLAGHVIQCLEECNRDCSYFFFQHINSRRSTVAELLCHLAWQMALSNTTVRAELLDMCGSGVTIDKNDERAIWRAVFANRILRVEYQQPQYWVIDALDECSNPASLFPLLAKIEKQVHVRIFVTSRPSLEFERAFSQGRIPRITESVTLEASLGDIKLFLEEHASFFLADSELERKELVNKILGMSNGNFLWTALMVKKIENAVSKEQVHAILNSVPREIGGLYTDIFRNVIAAQDNIDIARAILRWTLCTLRPLSVDELKEALRLDIGMSPYQLEMTAGPICGHLVRVDADFRVRAAHQTVREFLFREQDDVDFGMNKEEEHSRIMKVCLAYLRGDEMKPPRFRRANSSSSHKQAKRSAFSSYAIIHFSDHLSFTTTSDVTHFVALNDLVMTNSLSWIDAVAGTEDLAPLTETAKNVTVYLERRAKYESPLGAETQNLLTWANDLIYLVAQFGKALLSNPAAIYHPTPRLQFDDKFALATWEGKIYIYHEATFQEIAQLTHGDPVNRLRFATVNDYLVSASRGKLCFWNTTTAELLWSIDIPHMTLAFAFGEDSKTLHVATAANYAIEVDVLLGREVDRFSFCDGDEDEKREYRDRWPLVRVDFHIGLGLLGVASDPTSVSFWDLEEHGFVAQFYPSRLTDPEPDPEPMICAFIFNPNPEINLAAVSVEGGITYVFDPETGTTQATAVTGGYMLAASPDGTILAARTKKGVVRLYDFQTLKLLHQVFTHDEDVLSLAMIVFNSGSSRFFEISAYYFNVWEPSALVRRSNSGDDSSVDVSHEAATPPELIRPRTYDDERDIWAVAAHHDNDFIFCGRRDGSVAAYATASGKVAQEMYTHGQHTHGRHVAVRLLEWNQARNLLVTVDASGRITVREVSMASPGPFKISEPILDESLDCSVYQILISSDGKGLLVSTQDSDVLWELTTSTKTASCSHLRSWELPRRWASHPDMNLLLLFEKGGMKTYSWATLELLSEVDSLGLPGRLQSISAILPPHSSTLYLLTWDFAPADRYFRF